VLRLAACATAVTASTVAAQPRARLATRVSSVVDTLHGVAVEDRFRWLESQTSPDVLAWIAAQNRLALEALGPDTPARRALSARLRALLDVPTSSAPRRGGDWEYFTLRRTVASVYRRRWVTNAGIVAPDSQYERLINPLDLRRDGTTSVAIEAVSPDGSLLMYSVRDGGPDEITVKIRDLRTGKDLADSLPPALYASLAFAPHGRGFYYVHRSRLEGPRFRYHQLGLSAGSDSLLYGGFTRPPLPRRVDGAQRRYRIYTIRMGGRATRYMSGHADGASSTSRQVSTRTSRRRWSMMNCGCAPTSTRRAGALSQSTSGTRVARRGASFSPSRRMCSTPSR
jgi:hypothetical protein